MGIPAFRGLLAGPAMPLGRRLSNLSGLKGRRSVDVSQRGSPDERWSRSHRERATPRHALTPKRVDGVEFGDRSSALCGSVLRRCPARRDCAWGAVLAVLAVPAG